MRTALSIALQEYEGAMILVTHDRFLVRSTTDQLLLVADTQLHVFEGDLDEYEQWLLSYRKQQAMPSIALDEKTELSRKEQRQHQAKQRDLKRPLLLKIKQMERELELLQKEKTHREVLLADTTLYEQSNKDKLQKLVLDQAKIKKQMEETEEALLLVYDELDIIEPRDSEER
jgi:ATP-binding cassette subfamily F protein 3